MRTELIFVTHGDVHVAGAVSLPEEPPRGLVVLPMMMVPFGVIGASFWARTAHRLAEQGLATVRFEHEGIGDSTGFVPEWSLWHPDRAVEHARTVTRVVLDELGLRSFAAGGTCYDGAVALGLARDPDCVGAACINATLTEPHTRGTLRRKVAAWPIVGFVRNNPLLRQALFYERIRDALRDRPSARVREALDEAGAHARVLILNDEELIDTAGGVELAGGGDGAHELRREQLALGAIQLDTAKLLPAEERVLETIVDWLAGAFEAAEAGRTR